MNSQEDNAVQVVEAWQDAVNRADIERLLQVSNPNIEIVGPRGSGYGHQLLQDWLARAGLSLKPLQTFAKDNKVVVLQHGTWRSTDKGEVVGERDVASCFVVVKGRVTRFARYDTLDEALSEANLSQSDAVSPST